MKNIAILILMLFPPAMFSQEKFTMLSHSAREEYPGMQGAPITFTATYVFIARDDDILVEAISRGILDSTIDDRTLSYGDTLIIKYISYSYYSEFPQYEVTIETPRFSEIGGTTLLRFFDYNNDWIKRVVYLPVYYTNGHRYEFDLPSIKEEDIEKIYYP